MNLPLIGVVRNWRNEKNKSGLFSVHIRIKIGGTARYYKIDVPQKVRIDEWCGKDDMWVKPNHPFYFEIDNKIIEKKAIKCEILRLKRAC